MRERVAASNLRDVAREIGMSHNGLYNFLKGREPYSRTRERLLSWQSRVRGEATPLPTQQEVESAITVIGAYIRTSNALRVSEPERAELLARLEQLLPASERIAADDDSANSPAHPKGA